MHPIIFLWAHPRSVSTAVERVMRERGDMLCLHEPFLHYYYLQRSNKSLPYFDGQKDHPISYQETRDGILSMAEKSPVFAKDMSYYVIPELLEDRDFCRKIRHCFLIRHPLKSILSYYKIDPNLSHEEVGLEAQWQHHQGIVEMGLAPPIVLEAEAVQNDTKESMRLFWQSLGLEYCEKAFNWHSVSAPKDWEYVKGWHKNVKSSTGIQPVNASDDAKTRKDFAEAAEKSSQLNDFLQSHLVCYHALKAYSLTAPVC